MWFLWRWAESIWWRRERSWCQGYYFWSVVHKGIVFWSKFASHYLQISWKFIGVLLGNVGIKSGRGPGHLTRTVPDFWGPWTERIENWPRKLSVTYWFQAWNSQNESFGKDFFGASSLASWSTYTENWYKNFLKFLYLKIFCLPEFLKVNEYHHDRVRFARMVKTSKFQLKELVLQHLVPGFSSSGYTYLISIFLDIHRWLVTGHRLHDTYVRFQSNLEWEILRQIS